MIKMTMRKTLCALLAVPLMWAAGCTGKSEPKTLVDYTTATTILPYAAGSRQLRFDVPQRIIVTDPHDGIVSERSCWYTPGHQDLCQGRVNPKQITLSQYQYFRGQLYNSAELQYNADQVEKSK